MDGELYFPLESAAPSAAPRNWVFGGIEERGGGAIPGTPHRTRRPWRGLALAVWTLCQALTERARPGYSSGGAFALPAFPSTSSGLIFPHRLFPFSYRHWPLSSPAHFFSPALFLPLWTASARLTSPFSPLHFHPDFFLSSFPCSFYPSLPTLSSDPELEERSCTPASRRCHPDDCGHLAGWDRAETSAGRRGVAGTGFASASRALQPPPLPRVHSSTGTKSAQTLPHLVL